MTTFEEALAAGTGRVEFVFHVRGMPWAVCTSKEFGAHISNQTAILTAMFGDDTYNGDSNYFAEDVDIYPLLEVPGAQTITNDDAMSQLSGGTWTARIADIPPGAIGWPHSKRTTIVGLEGLSAIANPRMDRSIVTARLGNVLAKGDDALSFVDDAGGLLGTAADAATDAAPLVLWIGGECMAITDGASSGTEGTGVATYRGILGSVEQFHAPNKTLTSAPSLRIANAPLGGIQNRPYALYAFVFDTSGRSATCIGPALVRAGKVSSDIRCDRGYWEINCLPWWSWLDTELTVPAVSAPMAKFVLSRYGTDDELEDAGIYFGGVATFKGRNPPHVLFREYDSTTDTVSPVMEVWLCDAWESVTYDTVEELELALCAAMTDESTANGFGWTYSLTNGGPTVSTLVDGDMVAIRGDLPAILLWGDWTRKLDQAWPNLNTYPKLMTDAFFLTAEMEYNVLYVPQGWKEPHLPYKNFWFAGQGYWGEATVNTLALAQSMCHSWIAKIRWQPSDSDADWQPGMYLDIHSHANLTATNPRKKPSYIMQWGWNYGTLPPSVSSHFGMSTAFPVPVDPTSSEARIWVRDDYDIQSITAGSEVQVGTDDPENPILAWDGSFLGDTLGMDVPSFAGFTSLAKTTVGSVGTGGADDNYIVVDDSTTLLINNPVIVGLDNGQFDASAKKFVVGQTLFGYNQDADAPFVAYDHWPISQSFSLRGEKLSDIFLAVLGHPDVDAPTVSEAIQADHVPDYDTIDWDLLDSLTSGVVGTSFELRYQGDVNLWDLLNEELKFYNLTPTWEWDSTAAAYRMRFKRVSLVNASAASAAGRVIDSSIVAANTSIVAEHAGAWQINKIVLSVNWNPKTDRFDFVFPVSERSGFAPAGGRSITLDISPRITRITGLSESSTIQGLVAAYLGGHLENMMDPRPAAKFDATIADMLLYGVGVDCRLTADGLHEPFTGTIGVEDWPSAISSMTVDFSKSSVKYQLSLAARRVYGWAPTVLITESSVDGETGYVLVTDIEGDGQEFCGSGATVGWYDHWFFADYAYNTTMSAPVLDSTDKFVCTLTQRGTKTPIHITGVIVEYANPGDYDAVDGVGNFLILNLDTATYDPPGSAYDDGEEWYLTHDDYSASIYDAQREWIFLADSGQQIEHPDTGHETGREWE